LGPKFASRLRKRQSRSGDHWYLDEMHFVTVRGERQALWYAADQDGDTLDILARKNEKTKKQCCGFSANFSTAKAPAQTDSPPTSCPAIGPQNAKSCQACRVVQINIRTTERKSRTSERAIGCDRCESSSRLAAHNAFLRCKLEYKTYFVSEDI
jgi:transposase-like protein